MDFFLFVLLSKTKNMFSNRIEAGELLAKKLILFKNDVKAIVVAVPNGGVMTAYPIVKALNLPLELQLIKKIPHPDQSDLMIGAISLSGTIFNKNCGITEAYFENEARTCEQLLYKKHDQFIGRRAVCKLSQKTVILVDDGIQSGSTIRLAVRLIKKQNPARIILAIPIAPREVIDQLKSSVDEVICLKYSLTADLLKEHYRQFHTVRDSAVIRLLRK
jgi:predicted phosphoribosyltransferase